MINFVKFFGVEKMNVKKTIEKIRATCNNYVDPDLLAFIIDEDNTMITNNILEIEKYDINENDSYEERLLKIHKHENIFLPIGMMTFMPILNECDLFCENDYHLTLTQEEFSIYSDEEEKLLGILIKKDSNDYLIGKSDICSCSADSSFEKIEKTECEFYNNIESIIEEKIEE